MNLLLDTHVLLWWLSDASTLSEKSRMAIADGKNLVFVSAVSVWEIRIKEVLNKLKIPANFKAVLAVQPFDSLAAAILLKIVWILRAPVGVCWERSRFYVFALCTRTGTLTNIGAFMKSKSTSEIMPTTMRRKK
jgi:hypothetical protein